MTLPAALNVPSTSLVWGEATYNYQPSIGYVVTGPMSLTDQIFMRPRLSETDSEDLTASAALHGIGRLVVDLIFSIAKRDVTFFSGDAAISFL